MVSHRHIYTNMHKDKYSEIKLIKHITYKHILGSTYDIYDILHNIPTMCPLHTHKIFNGAKNLQFTQKSSNWQKSS